MEKKAMEKYNYDHNYKFLHDRVSELFANHLISDIESYTSANYDKIILAAKLCPSLDSSFDHAILFCEAIARRIYPHEEYIEYFGIEEVLVILHRALELPEVFRSTRRWDEFPYNKMLLLPMKTYKETFLMHDEERFKEYLEKLKLGNAKIAAKDIIPHEIIHAVEDEDGCK
ncbi:hypothetical protein RDABS01_009964, partial [Bienertia sinuspersici]